MSEHLSILLMVNLVWLWFGKIATFSALVNEVFSWSLLTISVSVATNQQAVHWTLLSTIAFIFFCVFAIRPAIPCLCSYLKYKKKKEKKKKKTKKNWHLPPSSRSCSLVAIRNCLSGCPVCYTL
uniref:Putative Cation/hydrogen exchanger 15 n=1 Tax=Davidia involucrata TaxID=16924 RepID=A0A5B6ZLM9_DAVIN